MMEDLSRSHAPVSDLFDGQSSPGERAACSLSDEQIEFYSENGYLAGVRILTDEQVSALCKELNEIADPDHPAHHLFYEFHSNESADPGSVLFHALGAWRIKPGLHDLLWNPRFTIPASQLLGGAVRFWHDQIFSKPARHGGVVAWHQD